MADSTLSLSYILAEARKHPDFIEYLNREYAAHPKLVDAAIKIISANHEMPSSPLTDVFEGAASNMIEEFNPSSYLGKVFGSWVATKIISVTKKSTVLLGVPADNSYNQEVAIKVISPSHLTIAGVEHLARQAHYMSKLKHPNMVEIKSADITEQGVPYVVMEYLPGSDIVTFSRIKNKSFIERIRLFVDVCNCVLHMHNNMVIHADLKPSNILIDSNNNVKVIDLDLSLSTDSNFDESYNYRNIRGCTNEYASPEQKNRAPSLSVQSDIYSLGLTLVELLIGPVKNKTADLNRELSTLYGRNYRYKELQAIVNKALASNLQYRYQSLSDFSNDIVSILSNSKIAEAYSHKANFLYKSRFFIQYNKLKTIFSIVVVILLAVSGFSINQERNASKEALTLLLEANDPRVMQKSLAFEIRAKDSLSGKKLFQSDIEYYSELIGFGDAYYGKGKSDKAVEFFSKARNLFPEKLSKERVNATTKLALAYYGKSDVSKANELLKPYHSEIFSKKLTSTALIQMFLAIMEINEQFSQELDGAYVVRRPLKVLSDIELSEYQDMELKALAEVSINIFSAIAMYYEYYGDFVMLKVHKSQSTFDTIARPLLLEVKDKLNRALQLIHKNRLITHQEPLIYSWLSRVLAELEQYDEARIYSDLSINKTLTIFGEEHRRSIDAYSKRYAIFRYKDNEKSHEAISTAFNIEQSIPNSGPFRLFVFQLLIDSYFNLGDHQNTIKKIDELILEFERLDKERAYGEMGALLDLDVITAATPYATYYGFFDSQHVQKYLDINYEYNKQYNEIDTFEDSMVMKDLFITFSTIKSDPKILEKIDSAYEYSKEQFYKTIEESYYPLAEQFYIKSMLDIMEYCSEAPKCNIDKYLHFYLSNIAWTDFEKRFSIKKLVCDLRLANLYLKKDMLVKGEQTLKAIDKFIANNINVKEDSLHVGLSKYLKAKLYFKKRKFEKFNLYAKEAIPIIEAQFGENSDMIKEIVIFQKKLEKS